MAALHVAFHQEVTEKDLRKCFKRAGPLVAVRICRNWDSKQSLGYGYVNFRQRADAEWAMDNFHDQKLMGKPIKISWSRTALAPRITRRDAKAGTAAPKDLPEKPDASKIKRQVEEEKQDLQVKPKGSCMKTGRTEDVQSAVTAKNSAPTAPKPAVSARPAASQAGNKQPAKPAAGGVCRQALAPVREQAQEGHKDGPEECKVVGKRRRRPTAAIVGAETCLPPSALKITVSVTAEGRTVSIEQAVPATSGTDKTRTSKATSAPSNTTDNGEDGKTAAALSPATVCGADKKGSDNRKAEVPKTSSMEDIAPVSAPDVPQQSPPKDVEDKEAEIDSATVSDDVVVDDAPAEDAPADCDTEKKRRSALRRFGSACRKGLARVARAIRRSCRGSSTG